MTPSMALSGTTLQESATADPVKALNGLMPLLVDLRRDLDFKNQGDEIAHRNFIGLSQCILEGNVEATVFGK